MGKEKEGHRHNGYFLLDLVLNSFLFETWALGYGNLYTYSSKFSFFWWSLLFFFLHGVYVPRGFIILTNMFLSCKYLIQLDMTGIIYLSFLVSLFLRFINITVGYSTFSGWSIFRRHLLSLSIFCRVMKHFVLLYSPGLVCGGWHLADFLPGHVFVRESTGPSRIRSRIGIKSSAFLAGDEILVAHFYHTTTYLHANRMCIPVIWNRKMSLVCFWLVLLLAEHHELAAL